MSLFFEKWQIADVIICIIFYFKMAFLQKKILSIIVFIYINVCGCNDILGGVPFLTAVSQLHLQDILTFTYIDIPAYCHDLTDGLACWQISLLIIKAGYPILLDFIDSPQCQSVSIYYFIDLCISIKGFVRSSVRPLAKKIRNRPKSPGNDSHVVVISPST